MWARRLQQTPEPTEKCMEAQVPKKALQRPELALLTLSFPAPSLKMTSAPTEHLFEGVPWGPQLSSFLHNWSQGPQEQPGS